MTIKKLSSEIQIEQDHEGMFAGKTWCYAARLTGGALPEDAWSLGIAVANEAGYYPIPPFFAHADSYEAMMDHADDLNMERGVDRKKAAVIVASSMGAVPIPGELAQP